MDLVPNGWKRHLQMLVAREQGMPRGGARGAHGPVVTAQRLQPCPFRGTGLRLRTRDGRCGRIRGPFGRRDDDHVIAWGELSVRNQWFLDGGVNRVQRIGRGGPNDGPGPALLLLQIA